MWAHTNKTGAVVVEPHAEACARAATADQDRQITCLRCVCVRVNHPRCRARLVSCRGVVGRSAPDWHGHLRASGRDALHRSCAPTRKCRRVARPLAAFVMAGLHVGDPHDPHKFPACWFSVRAHGRVFDHRLLPTPHPRACVWGGRHLPLRPSCPPVDPSAVIGKQCVWVLAPSA